MEIDSKLVPLDIPEQIYDDNFAFHTHLIYARRLATWSIGLSAEYSSKPKLLANDSELLKNKDRLITLMWQSLQDECKIVMEDAAYSSACVLWLPTKAYYLIFHLLTTIEYIINADPKCLRMHHEPCVNLFTDLIKNKVLKFSQTRFNEVFRRIILDHKTQPGEHLRADCADAVIHQLIMRKTADYKIQHYKYKQKLNLRRKVDRASCEKFKDTMLVSIFDFFYLMRIKSTYKEFNFIDGIMPDQTRLYFQEYFRATENFYHCLNNLRQTLSSKIKS
jgi:hypothetical protein